MVRGNSAGGGDQVVREKPNLSVERVVTKGPRKGKKEGVREEGKQGHKGWKESKEREK